MSIRSDHTASTLRICIDEIHNDGAEISGRISGIAVKDEKQFSDSSQLLLLIDRILDEIGRPQPTRKSRSFRETSEKAITSYCGEPKIYHSIEEVRKSEGKILTRDVFFVSRLRSSWQGIMKDVHGQTTGKFDSDLEFINLLYDRGVTR